MSMLNGNGVLDVGIHDLTIAEIRQHFGTFNGSDRRCRLFDKLADYIERVCGQEWFRDLFIDGSFVTDKQAPTDIDLILVVDPEVAAGELSLTPNQYNLLSHRRAKKQYGFDVFMVPSGSGALDHWMTYFSKVKEVPDQRKGIVRLAR